MCIRDSFELTREIAEGSHVAIDVTLIYEYEAE